MTDNPVLKEKIGRVGVIRLNRPEALNALNDALMKALGEALHEFDEAPDIGVILLTGSEKAFAAGADIKEMKDRTFPEVFHRDFIAENWEEVTKISKPVIAAVAGYALGGGCELALMCDFIIASENAKFGQPEITIGIMPGAGGTQRLARSVGKAKAMDMILTGRPLLAAEAEKIGLVARIVPDGQLFEEALKTATQIASYAPTALALAKKAVNQAFETPLQSGIGFERAAFLSLFGTESQKEGMAAFLEKRKPDFIKN